MLSYHQQYHLASSLVPSRLVFDQPLPVHNKPSPPPFSRNMVGESTSPETPYPPTIMSTAAVYQPSHSAVHDPDQLSNDVSSGLIHSDWYHAASYQYNDPYATPYTSSTIDSHPWTSYAQRASVPDITLPQYAFVQQADDSAAPTPMPPPLGKDTSSFHRPKSSPSTFGPSVEISWPTTSGLGIYSTAQAPETPVSSSFPPAMFTTYPGQAEDPFGLGTGTPGTTTAGGPTGSETPEIRQPQPHRPYINIAPNPTVGSSAAGAAGGPGSAGKRKREDTMDDEAGTMQESGANSTTIGGNGGNGSGNKKRKRTPSVVSADLSEDDRFLVRLKEDEALPWKDIAARFQVDKGQELQVAALQMRYKRLRERFRTWEEQDVKALRLAFEYWEKYKWEIISAKMLDFGVSERWPARHCTRKWHDLEATATAASMAVSSAVGLTPAVSHFSSPIDGPMHFTFMPLS